MYLDHYHLNLKPFEMSPDPQFLWLGEKHKEALAALEYGILESKGFLLLTGDAGTGKTVLINGLLKSTRVNAIIATIPDPDLEILDFFYFLAEEFQMNRTFETKGNFLIAFKHFLHEVYQSEGKVLLIIDECQRLNHELLEQVRILSNIELNDRKLINIFFVGQSEFNEILREERNVAVRKRIAVSYHLEPLDKKETEIYIDHRLKVAGASANLFTPEAIRDIFYFTGGLPRLINIICDHALLIGYSRELTLIDDGVIAECKKDLHILNDSNESLEEDHRFEENHEIVEISETPDKEQSGKRLWIYASFILASIIIGYLIFNFGWKDSSSAEIKEGITSLKNSFPEKGSPKPENVTKADFGNEKVTKNDQIQTPVTHEKLDETSKPKALPAIEVGNHETNFTFSEDTTIAQEKLDETSKEVTLTATQGDNQTANIASAEDSFSIATRKTIIQFGHNSMRLSDEAHKMLDQIAEFSSSNNVSEIIVEGYTDSFGDYAYNKNLSKMRAEIVKKYFVDKGIPETKIEAVGMGPENPIASNKTFEGRKLNRRIEISVKVK
jgi:general secretion pathway protein A